MNVKYLVAVFIPLALILQFAFTSSTIDGNYTRFEIKPSATDKTITNGDDPHLVLYDKTAKQGKLMVFLQGTGGVAVNGPKDYFNTVLEQGYRLISLSYVDIPAVAQVCNGDNLAADSNCADEFRLKRIYGKGSFSLINDQPQDAIVNRLLRLLQYLAINDKSGNWEQYLDNGNLKWGEIAFSGQSQGGGMSEYIGKHQLVYKVISFSGGWDWSAKGRIANWYATPNVTPPDAWYGTYNVNEPTADVIMKHLNALGIPQGHIYAMHLPVRDGRTAHGEGIGNPAYKPKWIEMLGKRELKEHEKKIPFCFINFYFNYSIICFYKTCEYEGYY